MLQIEELLKRNPATRVVQADNIDYNERKRAQQSFRDIWVTQGSIVLHLKDRQEIH